MSPLPDAIYAFLLAQTGKPDGTPLADLWVAYYAAKTGLPATTPLPELEYTFYQQQIPNASMLPLVDLRYQYFSKVSGLAVGQPLTDMRVQYYNNPLPFVSDGLVVAYTFDEVTEPLLDRSGNALHARWGSTTGVDEGDPKPAGNPGVYYFMGSGAAADTCSLPSGFSSRIAAKFTFQLIFRVDDVLNAEVNPISIGGYGGAPYNTVIIRIDTSNNLRYWLGFSDNTFVNIAATTIQRGTWYAMSLTYDGSRARVRLNGVQVANNLHSKALKLPTASAGGISTGKFEGAIGALLYYDRVLSDAELAENEATAEFTPPSGVNPNKVTATRAASFLTIPTYEGSGEAVHPDVIYFPDGWNGWEYWMAMTPYPGGNDQFENPSILQSHDGTTWQVPAGLTNPIDVQKVGGHLADTEIIVDPDNRMWCFWTSDPDGVLHSWSDDGVTWAPKASVTWTAGRGGNVSPAIVYRNGIYHMWIVQHTTNELFYYTSPTPAGAWSLVTKCRVVDPLASGLLVWHLNVNWDDVYQEYHGLITVIQGGVYKLWFATSPDGANWTFARTALMNPSASAWDNYWIYRSTAVRTETGYDLWYSGRSSANAWHIGRSTITIP